MRALVAGGAGFIGSTLVDRLLAEGDSVDVVDDLSTGRLSNLADARADRQAALHIHQVDVRGREVIDLVERQAPEVVFQLAMPARDDAADDAVATVVGTLRLLEGAHRAGARKIVVLVDAAVFGESTALPLKESEVGEPATAHGVAQLAAVEYLRLYRDRHALDFTVLVADEVYGPRQAHGPLADAARAVLAGGAPRAEGRTADLVFVDDVVDAFVRAATRGGGLLLNLGWGREVALADALATMAEAVGRPELAPERGDVTSRLALDGGRAHIHLGWEPWTSVEEGIAQTLRWTASS